MKSILITALATLATLGFADAPDSGDSKPANSGLLDANKPLVAPMTQWGGRDQNLFGASVGWYFPTSGKMRDALGNNFFDVGLSAPFAQMKPDGTQASSSFGVITANRNGNRLFILPATFGVMKMMGRGQESKPYVAARAGIAYYDYRITDPSTLVRKSGNRIGYTGNLEAGVILSQNLRVAARYNWFSKVDGFDFTGIELKLAYQFFRL